MAGRIAATNSRGGTTDTTGWVIGVNGGGTSTRVAAIGDTGATSAETYGSVAVTGIRGIDAAAHGLRELLAQFCAGLDGSKVARVVLALSALHLVSEAESMSDSFELACRSLPELTGADLWLMNDVLPLVARTDYTRPRIGVVCGSGTAFLGCNGRGEWARASGLEFLLSDEGSGFDIGLQGLRAAVRAADGRGPDTLLVSRVIDRFGSLDVAAASVTRAAWPKSAVVHFASEVLDSAEAGDPVAKSIAEEAAQELATGIVAVARRLGITEGEVLFEGAMLHRPKSAVRVALAELMRPTPGLVAIFDDREPAIRARDVGALPADVRSSLLEAASHVPVVNRPWRFA